MRNWPAANSITRLGSKRYLSNQSGKRNIRADDGWRLGFRNAECEGFGPYPHFWRLGKDLPLLQLGDSQFDGMIMKRRIKSISGLVLVAFFHAACERRPIDRPAPEVENGIVANDPFQGGTEVKPSGRRYEFEKKSEIALAPSSEHSKRCLRVEILGPINWTSAQHAKFTYRVSNFLDDEVFLEIQNLHVVGCHYLGPEGSCGAGSGSGVEWPGNTMPLRRLTANGVDLCFADVNASTDVPIFASEKGQTSVSIRIVGFYRATGSRFEGNIEIPFPLNSRPKE